MDVSVTGVGAAGTDVGVTGVGVAGVGVGVTGVGVSVTGVGVKVGVAVAVDVAVGVAVGVGVGVTGGGVGGIGVGVGISVSVGVGTITAASIVRIGGSRVVLIRSTSINTYVFTVDVRTISSAEAFAITKMSSQAIPEMNHLFPSNRSNGAPSKNG